VPDGLLPFPIALPDYTLPRAHVYAALPANTWSGAGGHDYAQAAANWRAVPAARGGTCWRRQRTAL